ncbi:MAG TPA: Uma2 family endonuclease [Pirellulales bacterium]|nr:Uma2 family endonuclease [Pirellulales bacterium]
MSIIPLLSPSSGSMPEVEYPSSDGRPVAETPLHRDVLLLTVQLLQIWFADEPMTYVSGNMMLYYAPGLPLKCVSPDVFVVHGVPRDKPRDIYQVWDEDGHAPDMVIEVTSRKTRHHDQRKKFELYRDTLLVGEYFLFDPRSEYLQPPLQGYRLVAGEYVPMEPSSGRWPSETLGLHLERDGGELRFYNPRTGQRLPTALETREALGQTREALGQAHEVLEKNQASLTLAEAENERLRRELDDLRRRMGRDASDGGP